MANKEISELTAGATMDGTELVHGVQSGNSRKFTGLQLLTPALSAANQGSVRSAFGAPLKGHRFGLFISNNSTDATNDIDIAVGEAASEQADPLLMNFAGTTGVQLDVAYGTGSGGRFDTSISDGTWHVFLISNGTTVGRGLSKSLDPTGQANYPSGYTHYRRIGSIIRASSAIVAFKQYPGGLFKRAVATDRSSASSAASGLLTLSVPTGLPLRPVLELTITTDATVASLYNSLGSADEGSATTKVVSVSGSTGVNSSGTGVADQFVTNTSGQLYFAAVAIAGAFSTGGGGTTVKTVGWIDDLGMSV